MSSDLEALVEAESRKEWAQTSEAFKMILKQYQQIQTLTMILFQIYQMRINSMNNNNYFNISIMKSL